MTALLLHELTRERLRELAPGALVVLPVGATEQHGPHLPVGTDFLVVEHLARAAADRAAAQAPVVVAPTLPYGSSEHHVPFGGTLSLPSSDYYRAVLALCDSLAASGFRRLFVLNGHGGNDLAVQQVARDLTLRREIALAAGSYWTIAHDALQAAAGDLAGTLPGHAGAFETSLLLALRPDLVAAEPPAREGPLPTRGTAGPYRAERHGSWQAMDGYTDSPDAGDAETGRRCLEAVVGAVAAAFVEFARG